MQSISSGQCEGDQVVLVDVLSNGPQTEYMGETVGDTEAGFQVEPPSVDVVGIFGGSQHRLAPAVHSHFQQLPTFGLTIGPVVNDLGSEAIGGVDGEVDGIEHGVVADAEDVRQGYIVPDDRFHDGVVSKDGTQHKIDQTPNVVAVGHKQPGSGLVIAEIKVQVPTSGLDFT